MLTMEDSNCMMSYRAYVRYPSTHVHVCACTRRRKRSWRILLKQDWHLDYGLWDDGK